MARKRRKRRSPGEGAVYERPDRGTWVAALIVGFNERGGYRRRTKTFTTKLAAQEWLAEQQAALRAGAKLGENPTFREVYEDWLENGEALLGWSSSTVASYKRIVKKVMPHLGSVRMSELDADSVERALRALARAGATPALVKRVHSYVGMVLRRAERKRLILRNPVMDVEVPTAPAGGVQRWSEEEVGRVLRRCLDQDDQVARYVITALGTGMRTEELLGLAWSSVDLEARTVTVERVAVEVEGKAELRDGGKTDAAYRVLPVDDLTVGALTRQREHVSKVRAMRAALDEKRELAGKAPLGWAELDLVFPSSVGTVWSRSVLRRAFNDLQDAAEVGRIKLYATRSTHGSLLADAGVNLHALAERLGHTDPRFTARTYLRGSSAAHREVAERVGSVLGSSLVAARAGSSVTGVQERAREGGEEPQESRPAAAN